VQPLHCAFGGPPEGVTTSHRRPQDRGIVHQKVQWVELEAGFDGGRWGLITRSGADGTVTATGSVRGLATRGVGTETFAGAAGRGGSARPPTLAAAANTAVVTNLAPACAVCGVCAGGSTTLVGKSANKT
jgi:hypothetical protein